MRYKKVVPSEKAPESEKRKKNLKRLLYFLISFSVIFGVFEGLVALEFKPVYPIYLTLLTVLLLLFLFFNKGFSSALPERGMLPEQWSEEQKDGFYKRWGRDKKIARIILIFLIPFLLTFLIDYIVLFLPELLS